MFKMNPLVTAISLVLVSPLVAVASDTGDAPNSYGLATHEVVVDAPQIGETAPDDNVAVYSAGANLDDNSASPDDEDGVFGFPILVEYSKAYDTNVFVTNPTNEPATLVGWIDFDGNGTFDADEASISTVPARSSNRKIKLAWPNTDGVTTGYVGPTYARFRITSETIGADDAVGAFNDGEVEDYTLNILRDSDGDEIPDESDPDNDNDGIPDTIEGIAVDTDNDGTANFMDVDSDDDSIPDYVEVGPDVNNPMDSDGDGTPDYLDLDSNNDGTQDIAGVATDSDRDGISNSIEGSVDTDGDGISNSADLDSDNDLIPDAIEIGVTAPTPVDTDGDLIPDYLDLDSDNDGIPDIVESNQNVVNVPLIDIDQDGAVDSGQIFGANGLLDIVEKGDDSGIPVYAVPDSDADGVRDYRDLDSDNDGSSDTEESGGTDTDNNGIVDAIVDFNANGVPDTYDFTRTGGVDTDGDGIDDVADADFALGPDRDNDNVLDAFDLDVNGDGFIDDVMASQSNDLYRDGMLPDVDDDNIPDYRDGDSFGSPTGGGFNGGTNISGNNGGTTVGGNTNINGTTTGGTNPIVETGISGSACSISNKPGNDPLFPGMLLLGSMVLFFRRKIGNALNK